MINYQLISNFDHELFYLNSPIPWYRFENFLTEEAFQALNREFPPLDFFEKHEGKNRSYNQRPHDRYYLALGESPYRSHKAGTAGSVHNDALPQVWQKFIKTLQTEDAYKKFIGELLGENDIKMRFAWHIAESGADVSPHVDAETKLGTQLFYFIESEKWKDTWGGETVFLSGKTNEAMNPELDDFTDKYYSPPGKNCNVLFKNAKDAWHAVERIQAPMTEQRRIFTVIFEKNQPVSSKKEKTSNKKQKPSFLKKVLSFRK